MMIKVPLPIVLVSAWLAVIGAAVWSYAAIEVEPPVWDAFSYAVKAFYFWDAVGHGSIFNPLNLPPTARPPGTVLMSYPFGFTTVFQGFYFRSIFVPIVLLIAAVYIAGYSRASGPASWLLSSMVLTLCGMPILYQFECNDNLPTTSCWGLVDNFLAGTAAVAIALAQRSVTTLSPLCAIASALAAAFCLMIKPAGLLVMLVVGGSWLILIGFRIGWSPTRLRREPALARFLVIGLTGTATIYGLTISTALLSNYFSAENFAVGLRALAVLQSDFFISANADWMLRLLQWSFGYVVPLLVCAGLINAFATRGEIGAAIAAGLCLVIGVWFWIVVTGLSQVRYFLPFGVMAFIVVEPSLLLRTRSLPSMIRIGFAAVILTPTVGVTLLLLHPQPPLAWQRLLNVNLSSALFRAENQQAVNFLDTAHEEGARSVYMLELNSSSRNFVAVVEYGTFFNPSLTRTSIKLPVDWSRSTTFRLEEILSSDYVAFEPTRDDVERDAILGSRTVADFQAETRLLKAWLSTLSSAEGVAFISESQLRLLRIVDRDRFGSALERLRSGYDWRPAFREANS